MSSIYGTLLENSVDASLAAIELYNKPNFPHREQIFSILVINAWELLLKAKILSDNEDAIESIYVGLPDGSYKTNRSGNHLTIEIIGAINLLNLSQSVADNLRSLIDIRDTAIHFFHEKSISYLVFSLGVATLRNYQRLVNEWFGVSLTDFNFYIMPLAFSYDFKTLQMLDLRKEPDVISNIVRSAINAQSQDVNNDGFHFMCEIATTFVSAKKLTSDTDLVAKIDQDALPDALVVTRLQPLTDKYPYSYTEMAKRIRTLEPLARQAMINAVVKQYEVKTNTSYSAFNFRNKAQQITYHYLCRNHSETRSGEFMI